MYPYPDLFGQLVQPENSTTTIETVTDPTPVKVVPQPPNIANYTINGVILSICIVIITNLGKPIVDSFTLLFSEAARNKKEKELKALDAPLRLQESMEEQQKFLQTLLEKQQTHNANELTEVLHKMTLAFNKIDATVKESTEKNAKFLAGAEALKVEIQKVSNAIPIRIIQDKQSDSSDLNVHIE